MPSLALVFPITAVDKGASRTLDRFGNKIESTGNKLQRLGGHSTHLATKLAGLAGAGGVGALIGSSVKLAATFETTMRQVAVATNEPAAKLKDLSKLALKMGADTTFSAQDAGDAMLELAKSGMTAADIKGGALASTLTLAAAGGLELGNAAGYVASGLALFGLKADKAGSVAAALAGAANASQASVEDMGLALSQVGPGARQAGLSLQETTGALAALAKAGIKGSDAGTSLKTMLTRLIAPTGEGATMMKKLGLSAYNAQHQLVSFPTMLERVRKATKGMTEEQRNLALSVIFGSDAIRAGLILSREGAAGLATFTKATSDQTQAQKLAQAAMSGTGGALENMRGSIETAQIALGQALAPAVVDVAKKVTDFANGPLTKDIIPAIGSFVQGMEKGTGPGGKFATVVGDVGSAAGTAWSAAKPLFSFIGNHPKLFADVAVGAGALAASMKIIGSVKKLPGVGSLASKAAPLPVVVTNPGFGLPGGPKGPGAPTGPNGKPKAEPKTPTSKIGKIGSSIGRKLPRLGKAGARLAGLAEGLLPYLVIEANIQLDPRAVKALKNTVFPLHFKLSVKDAANQFLKQIEDPSTDKRTKAILTKHFAAVSAGVAEAARTGNTQLLEKALTDTYAEVRRSNAATTTKTVRDIVEQYRKGGVAAGTTFVDNVSDLLRGPLPKPTVDLNDRPALDKNNTLLGKLGYLDGYLATPNVKLTGADAASAKIQHLIHLLTSIPNAKPIVSVDTLITGGLPTQHKPRAHGGRVVKNGAYLVGEKGPEPFFPDRNGHIVSNRDFAAAMSRQGGDTNLNFYGDIVVPDRQTALDVPSQLRQALWLKGL